MGPEFFVALLIFVIAAMVILSTIRFVEMSHEEQMAKVSEWLLWAVTLAEKEYGGGTGKIKLREVYAQFIQAWPQVARWMPFSLFAKLVDAALVNMRSMLTTNDAAREYVEGES